MRRSRLAVFLPAALVLALVVASAPAAEAPLAPPFRLRGVEGESLVLDELRKQGPVLLDFWATWCKPCVTAIPELKSLHDAYSKRGLTVLGISLDGPRNYSKVRPFVRKMGIAYPVALDQDGTLQEKFQVRAMPTTLLVDPSGRIVEVLQGYRPGEIAALGKRIETMLIAPAPPDSAASDSTSSGAKEAPADSASGGDKDQRQGDPEGGSGKP